MSRYLQVQIVNNNEDYDGSRMDSGFAPGLFFFLFLDVKLLDRCVHRIHSPVMLFIPNSTTSVDWLFVFVLGHIAINDLLVSWFCDVTGSKNSLT